jgi:hypothetical protein
LASANATSVRFELTGGALPHHVIAEGERTFDGWVVDWNTARVANGSYTLQSVASTSDHRSARSPGVSIVVDNAPTTS